MSRYPGIDVSQPDLELIPFAFTGTGTAAMTFGSSDITLTDNGTGDYTLTLLRSAGVVLWCSAIARSDAGKVFCVLHDTGSTVSAVRILCYSDAGTATDVKVSGFILVKRGSTES